MCAQLTIPLTLFLSQPPTYLRLFAATFIRNQWLFSPRRQLTRGIACAYVLADPDLEQAETAMTSRMDSGVAIHNAELDVGPFMSPTPYTIQVRA
jgi:hypothetical protein